MLPHPLRTDLALVPRASGFADARAAWLAATITLLFNHNPDVRRIAHGSRASTIQVFCLWLASSSVPASLQRLGSLPSCLPRTASPQSRADCGTGHRTYDERRELGGLARVTACRVGAACRHGVRLGSFVRTNGAPHSGHTPALGNDVMSYEHLVHIPC